MSGDIRSLDDFRRRSGAKAHAFGKLFEEMFYQMCKRTGVAVTRFPDGCRQAGPNKLVRVKTPWDWIVTHNNHTALIDTKTSDELGFPHSKIKEHQILEMVHHSIRGGIAGYVIWLRKVNTVIYVPADELERLARNPGSIRCGQSKVCLLGTQSFFDVRNLFPKKLDPRGEPLNAG